MWRSLIRDDKLSMFRVRVGDGRRLHFLTRVRAQSVYLGGGVALCRVLGRYKMFVSTTDVGFASHLLLDGVWEGGLTVFLARRLKRGMHVVDAGANHGYFTVLAADLVGDVGRVAAIEPKPQTLDLLRRSLAVNGYESRTVVMPFALINTDDEELVLRTPEGEPKNAHLIAAGDITPEDDVVKSARLDTLLKDWSRVDLIKMDVEGAEEQALAGAWEVLTRHRPDLVLEFNPSRGADPEGTLAKLETLYGPPSVITPEGRAITVARGALLDRGDLEDRMLLFSRR